MFDRQEISRYYDLSEDHYRIFWNLDKSRSLHYGYWDTNTRNFHEALLNINQILAAKADIKEGDHVLDAGCGIGGSSLWLGRNKTCHVKGISLSEKQVHKASRMAGEEGLEHLVRFECRDYTSTGYADESFDVVWAIESVCHAEDKSDFIREAYRILRKGGRLIVADFFKKEGLQGKDARIIQQWAHGWAVPDFETIDRFSLQLGSAGFTAIDTEDATPAIRPSARRLYMAYFPGWIAARVYRMLKRNATPYGIRNVDTAYLQYTALKKDLWRYHIVTAEK